MTGPALTHATGLGGLHRHLTTDSTIDHHRWLRACAEHALIGECRTCGGHLTPHHPDDRGSGRHDYEATCLQCTHIYVAPGGRTLRHSSRHSEIPAGWWEHRTIALKHNREAA